MSLTVGWAAKGGSQPTGDGNGQAAVGVRNKAHLGDFHMNFPAQRWHEDYSKPTPRGKPPESFEAGA